MPADLVLHDLVTVRDRDAMFVEHIARLSGDEESDEVRHEPRDFGRDALVAINLVGGPAIFREVRPKEELLRWLSPEEAIRWTYHG